MLTINYECLLALVCEKLLPWLPAPGMHAAVMGCRCAGQATCSHFVQLWKLGSKAYSRLLCSGSAIEPPQLSQPAGAVAIDGSY
jgi:hypothetical protein